MLTICEDRYIFVPHAPGRQSVAIAPALPAETILGNVLKLIPPLSAETVNWGN